MTSEGLAVSRVWTNAAGGNWGVAGNWSPAQVPGAADAVLITNSGTYTVVVNVAASAASLRLGGVSGSQTLSMTAQTLTIGGPVNVGANGVLRMTGGVLNGTGDLSIDGRLDWNGGSLNRNGVVSIAPRATLFLGGTAAKTFTNGTILNAGTAIWSGGSIQSLAGSVLFSNAPSGTFDISNTVNWGVSPGSTNARLANDGLIRRRGTGTASLGAAIENHGTLELQSGTLTLTSTNGLRQFDGLTLLNGGSLTVTRPAQYLGGFLTGTGTFSGTLTNRAIVRPGVGIGQLNISGTYVQETTGLLEIELGGTNAGASYDRLAVSGPILLAGHVRVSLVDGFTPLPGDVFRFITGSTRSGTFQDLLPDFTMPRIALV